MTKHVLMAVGLLMIVIAVGCAVTASAPGTGGTSSAQMIQTGHPDVPPEVNCYVCHKADIPTADFHKDYGVQCQDCHLQTTWMASNYPHESWPLGIHRSVRCNQCHTMMTEYDFTVWQCWNCHHIEADIRASHATLGIADIDNCIACHQGTPDTVPDVTD